MCFSCSPGNIVPTEAISRSATVYSAGFCQFSKSYYREKCPPLTQLSLPSPTFPRAPTFPIFFSSPPELRKMFSSPASLSPWQSFSFYLYCICNYFPFPRRKAPHHNPASIFIDSLISASGGFCFRKTTLQPLLPKVLSGGFCFRKATQRPFPPLDKFPFLW